MLLFVTTFIPYKNLFLLPDARLNLPLLPSAPVFKKIKYIYDNNSILFLTTNSETVITFSSTKKCIKHARTFLWLN